VKQIDQIKDRLTTIVITILAGLTGMGLTRRYRLGERDA
jgi:hypothetical protein